MNLNRNLLVIVAMVAGSFSALGCAKKEAPTADETSAAPAIVEVAEDKKPEAEDKKPEAEASTVTPPPPADRVEHQGVAPSKNHVWTAGYWHWDNVKTVYLWEPGFWQDRVVVAPSAPPALRIEYMGVAPGASYFWAPGYWRWTGREYYWAPGYWTVRRPGYAYYRPVWVNYYGRWECRGWGWSPMAHGYRRDWDWSRHGWSHSDRLTWERRHNHSGWSHSDWNFHRDHRAAHATAHLRHTAARPQVGSPAAHGGQHAKRAPAAKPHVTPVHPRATAKPVFAPKVAPKAQIAAKPHVAPVHKPLVAPKPAPRAQVTAKPHVAPVHTPAVRTTPSIQPKTQVATKTQVAPVRSPSSGSGSRSTRSR